MKNSPFLNSLLVLIALVLLGGVGFFVYSIFFDQKKETPDLTINLEEQTSRSLYEGEESSVSPVFRSGVAALERRDTATARNFFEKALNDSEGLSDDQRAHIEYQIALTYRDEDPIESIELMKEIVDNPSYPNQQKAYAVQHMYTMWRMYTVELNEEAFNTIMAGEPYADFLVEGDQAASMANLNAFAVSLGSAPFSEIELAAYKASLINDSSLTEAERNSYLFEAIAAVDSVEAYMERNAGYAPNAALEPRIRQGISKVYGILARAEEDPFASDFAKRFEDAIAANKSDAQRLIIGMDYAWTAGLVGDEETKAASQATLSSLLIDPENYPGLVYWFLERDDKPEDLQAMVDFLIDFSDDFRAMLESVGYFEVEG